MVLPPTNENDWLAACQAAEWAPVFVSDEPQVWRMLAAAWQRGMVEFRYWGGSEPGAGRRMTPDSVFTVAGITEIYAEGFRPWHAERCVFRLDRVECSAE